MRFLLTIWRMLFGPKITEGQVWSYVDLDSDPFRRRYVDVKVLDVREGYVKFIELNDDPEYVYLNTNSLWKFDFRYQYDLTGAVDGTA